MGKKKNKQNQYGVEPVEYRTINGKKKKTNVIETDYRDLITVQFLLYNNVRLPTQMCLRCCRSANGKILESFLRLLRGRRRYPGGKHMEIRPLRGIIPVRTIFYRDSFEKKKKT